MYVHGELILELKPKDMNRNAADRTQFAHLQLQYVTVYIHACVQRRTCVFISLYQFDETDIAYIAHRLYTQHNLQPVYKGVAHPLVHI